jgi:hypothetical protein
LDDKFRKLDKKFSRHRYCEKINIGNEELSKSNKISQRNKECHYVLRKEQDTAIVNVYAPKCWCTQFHKTNTTGHKGTDKFRYSNSV